ncbi:hypothetical protein D9758_009585 [Tetrapyrgos nigripes]|uniref:SWI/SNF and RSC complexes subunit Ssr4 N-terminal domain-containing protein n=1 Tax=Tetrapyrgos nigripes TaxID=182062 RepID=A0A8H5GCX9_9AGAR|nr:hypothetical protein D9758_009585 [Tetrapyrgos nigripes]
MSLQQAQAEGLCLRFPNDLGFHPQITLDTAVNMLLRATVMAQQNPFSWGWIDKPQDGAVYIVFLNQPNAFPNDGIRWQDSENKFTLPVGPQREVEVTEIKFGFIPGTSEHIAWRCRRRYRFTKSGHPNLYLVHYSRGPQAPIVSSLQHQHVRIYPLRQVMEPSVFVLGDKAGQKVYPNGPPPQNPGPSNSMGMVPGMPMNYTPQQQAMLAQQNNNMEMLEQRRRESERQAQQARARAGNAPMRSRPEDEDSGDEAEVISTRALATTRYKRNHDLMNEVFAHAANGDRNKPPPAPPFSIFSQTELEEKAAKLQAEIEALQARAAERKSLRSSTVNSEPPDGDVPMVIAV